MIWNSLPNGDNNQNGKSKWKFKESAFQSTWISNLSQERDLWKEEKKEQAQNDTSLMESRICLVGRNNIRD